MECDGCTLCCKLLNVSWMDSPVNHVCEQCDEGVGCKIYDGAPKDCLDFKCAYNQMDRVHPDLRPDKCHVVFERVTNDIFLGILDPTREITDFVEQQVAAFLQQGFSVMITSTSKDKATIYAANNRSLEDIYQTVKTISVSLGDNIWLPLRTPQI